MAGPKGEPICRHYRRGTSAIHKIVPKAPFHIVVALILTLTYFKARSFPAATASKCDDY